MYLILVKLKKTKANELIKVENMVDYHQTLKVEDKTFEKLMFIYSVAIKELETKIEIFKEESKIFNDYNLIEKVDSRIKKPKSIIHKMENRGLPLTLKNMIEQMNDIAGIKIVCPLKKDIFTIKKLIQQLPGINILKEKDYITYPKKSGYSSYHLIVEVPVTLSKNKFYVKVEIQIKTVAMDFWAKMEHEMKYKAQGEISKKESKEWINCAKLIHKLDNAMMFLNQ